MQQKEVVCMIGPKDLKKGDEFVVVRCYKLCTVQIVGGVENITHRGLYRVRQGEPGNYLYYNVNPFQVLVGRFILRVYNFLPALAIP